MSSDRPTDPASRRLPSLRSVIPTVRQYVDFVKWAATTLATVGASLFAANAWIENHVTEQELEQRLKPLAANEAALLERVIADAEERRQLGSKLEAQRVELDRTRQDLWWSWWWFTGIRASELEHDPRKRKQAADRARDRFEGYAREGMALEEAHRRALGRGIP